MSCGRPGREEGHDEWDVQAARVSELVLWVMLQTELDMISKKHWKE